jgi:hypothetical protein
LNDPFVLTAEVPTKLICASCQVGEAKGFAGCCQEASRKINVRCSEFTAKTQRTQSERKDSLRFLRGLRALAVKILER